MRIHKTNLASNNPEFSNWPRLTLRTNEQPIVIYGGRECLEKSQWILAQGVRSEWIAAQGSVRGTTMSQRVSDRIRRGELCAVILMNELISHNESAAIIRACRTHSVPYFMGKKGGQGQLSQIFGELEERLKGYRL